MEASLRRLHFGKSLVGRKAPGTQHRYNEAVNSCVCSGGLHVNIEQHTLSSGQLALLSGLKALLIWQELGASWDTVAVCWRQTAVWPVSDSWLTCWLSLLCSRPT